MRSATIVAVSVLAAALAMPLATAAQANIAITIDKSTQRMSVAVDGEQRYTWPVSTGRPGYDTPSGNFKVNRMDADHLSQEWDNAPMPHSMFFDLHGHAIHGFFDVKHLGLAVSHGCVRLSPEHAAVLFDLVKAEGMANTSVAITGRTPGGDNVPVARSRLPDNETVYNAQPLPIAPQYQRQYGAQPAPPPEYAQQQGFPPQPQPYGRPAYGQRYYVQPQPGYGQGYYAQPGYYGQPVYRQW
jgi:L,D-transpeptidase catalytic domain